MTLFSDKDTLQKEIESWKGFTNFLRKEDQEMFLRMLDDCYEYQEAVMHVVTVTY